MSPIIGEQRADFKGDMYAYLPPDEWEFLGKNCQELHKLYDSMSPCKLSQDRFWFGGCGGSDGGGFFQVAYGADGLVNKVHYCTSTCTASFYGPSFTDRTDALNYAIQKTNQHLRDCFNPELSEEPMPMQFRQALHSRLRAFGGLGKMSLFEEDAKTLELLKPLYVREKLLFQLSTGAGRCDLVKWKKEIQRNGLRIQKLSANAYKLIGPDGKSFKLKTEGQIVRNGEEAGWFIMSAISKETVALMKKNIKIFPLQSSS
ncbi:MAG: hypothetical protein IT342_03210 [Candidatus Melainabacteria bacterium]|nr:hypothetical protein [Candidatus Melainabacteria bacterium]